MCGRATLTKSKKEIEIRFKAHFHPNDHLRLPFPSFNIAPTHLHPIITGDQPDQLQLFHWGLIPSWAKKRSIGSKMINARMESVLEKPAFREAVHTQRCLVPLDGFYEWKTKGSSKIPYRIRLKDDGLFAVAGLWESWTGAEGVPVYSFTIITQAPNELMATLHDRMPAILLPEHEVAWLNPELPAQEALKLLQPYPSQSLSAYTVSRRIGKVSANDKGLIAPVDHQEGEQQSLF